VSWVNRQSALPTLEVSKKNPVILAHTHFQQFTYFYKNDNFEDIKIQSSIDSCQYLHFLFFINMLKIATNFSIVDAC